MSSANPGWGRQPNHVGSCRTYRGGLRGVVPVVGATQVCRWVQLHWHHAGVGSSQTGQPSSVYSPIVSRDWLGTHPRRYWRTPVLGVLGPCRPFPWSGASSRRGCDGASWGCAGPWGWSGWGEDPSWDLPRSRHQDRGGDSHAPTQHLRCSMGTLWGSSCVWQRGRGTWWGWSPFAMYRSTHTADWGRPGASLHPGCYSQLCTGHSRPRISGC